MLNFGQRDHKTMRLRTEETKSRFGKRESGSRAEVVRGKTSEVRRERPGIGIPNEGIAILCFGITIPAFGIEIPRLGSAIPKLFRERKMHLHLAAFTKVRTTNEEYFKKFLKKI